MANEGEEGLRFVRAVLDKCGDLGKVTFYAVLDRVTKDNTRELLEEYSTIDPRLIVVWAPENRCVVDAYFRGYREALATDANWVLEIDAGFSHRPEDIPQFFPLMLEGKDCIFGSRFRKGALIHHSSLKRRMVSWGGTQLTNLLLGTRLSDMTSGFEMFSRETMRQIVAQGVQSRAHFFQTEIKVFCRDLDQAEVPIVYEAASPRLSGGPIGEAFTQLWRLFRNRLSGCLQSAAQQRHEPTYKPSSHIDRAAEPRPAELSRRG